jgi:hypothetical protein
MPKAEHDKVDLYALHKAEYAAPRQPALVETAPALYLAVDGSGEPGSGEFEARIGALYAMAYTIKFQSKSAGRDFTVCKLEALWDAPVTPLAPADSWRWTLMIRMPDFIAEKDLTEARRSLREKGKEGDFDAVGLLPLAEGTCVQALHVGPYEDEARTIERMRAFAASRDLALHGRHHEIYLSDPRRVPPDRLRTILRHPVRPV